MNKYHKNTDSPLHTHDVLAFAPFIGVTSTLRRCAVLNRALPTPLLIRFVVRKNSVGEYKIVPDVRRRMKSELALYITANKHLVADAYRTKLFARRLGVTLGGSGSGDAEERQLLEDTRISLEARCLHNVWQAVALEESRHAVSLKETMPLYAVNVDAATLRNERQQQNGKALLLLASDVEQSSDLKSAASSIPHISVLPLSLTSAQLLHVVNIQRSDESMEIVHERFQHAIAGQQSSSDKDQQQHIIRHTGVVSNILIRQCVPCENLRFNVLRLQGFIGDGISHLDSHLENIEQLPYKSTHRMAVSPAWAQYAKRKKLSEVDKQGGATKIANKQ